MYLGVPVFNTKTTGDFIEPELLLDPPALLRPIVKLPVDTHRGEQIESVVTVGLQLGWWLNPHFPLLFF